MKPAPTSTGTEAAGRTARRLGAAVLLLALGFLVFRALTGRVIYWDGFVYLVDARSIGGAVRGYWYLHAPLTPMLHVPGVLLADSGRAAGPLCWVGPQLNALVITLALLLALFLWTRKWLGAGWALLAVLLFVGTRAFVHYGATPMADIPSALFATLALMAYPTTASSLQGGLRSVVRRWALFGALVGAAVLAKFPLVILPTPFVLAELVRSLRERRVDRARWAGLVFSGFVAAAVFLGVLGFAHYRVFGGVFYRQVVEGLLGATNITFEESVFDYFRMLPSMVSPVTLLLAGVGVVVAWRSNWSEHAATVLWVFFCVAFFSFRIVHNEFRYLMPVLPALAFLATFGARWLFVAASSRATTPGRSRGFFGVALLVVAMTLVPGLRQALRDSHPFYRSGTQEELGNFIVEWCPEGGTVFSETGALPIAPPLPLLARADEFYDIFHIGDPYVTFVTRRTWRDVGRQAPRTGEQFLDKQSGAGFVLIHEERISMPEASTTEAPASVAAVSGERRWRLVGEPDHYVDEHGGRRRKSTAGSDGPPTEFAVSGRRRWLLRPELGHYVDQRGERRFRFETAGGKLRLVSLDASGDLEFRAAGRVSLVRLQVRAGDVIELPFESDAGLGAGLDGTWEPPPLIAIERVTRVFPAVWGDS